MASGYVKIFESLLDSSVWSESPDTKVVWITMLVMADQYGEVEASIPGLARRAGVSVDSCEKAIEVFMSPDSYSRTPDHEGRRIARIEGGWEIFNYEKYRFRKSTEHSREVARLRQQRRRERLKSENVVTPVTPCHAVTERDVTICHGKAEAEAKAEEEKVKNKARSGAEAPALPDWIPPVAWSGFTEMRKKKRAPLTPYATSLIMKRLETLRAQGHDIAAILNESTLNNWSGVFALKGNHGNGKAQQRQTNNLAALDDAFPVDR